MQSVLLTFLSFIAYIGGLVIIARTTPMLMVRSYDEGFFMGIAAADLAGAFLAFAAVAVTYLQFNGNGLVKVLDFCFLVGIFAVSLRLALVSLRRHTVGEFLVSRIIVCGYGLFLALAACYYVVQLFTSH